jgi:hypothetical protein
MREICNRACSATASSGLHTANIAISRRQLYTTNSPKQGLHDIYPAAGYCLQDRDEGKHFDYHIYLPIIMNERSMEI